MPNNFNADELDAVEHLIATTIENIPALQTSWLYFHWETEPDGVPYINVVPIGGHRGMTFPGGGGATVPHVQGRVVKQLSIFCTDRAELRRQEIALTAAFDTMNNRELKDDAYCNLAVQEIEWHRLFIKEKNELFNNIWHSMTRVAFQIERFAGRA